MKHAKSQPGFTLIEVVIAMTLLSVMMVLLLSSLSIGAQSWDKGEQKLANVNQQAATYQFFKRHLATARPLQIESADLQAQESGESLFSFQGKHNGLKFISTLPASSARRGLQLFQIGAAPNAPSSLQVTLKPILVVEGDAAYKDEAILLEHVSRFEIFYLGRDENSGKPMWFDTWLEQETLPELVKILIRVADEPDWLPMVFPLPINAAYSDEFMVNEDEEGEDVENADSSGEGE